MSLWTNNFGKGLDSLMRSRKIAASLAFTILVLLSNAAGLSAVQAAGGVGITTTNANERVKLGLNKSVIITLPSDAYDILVANPMVADAVTRTARRIYLFGKSVGQTNIFVFGANGEQIASLDLEIERDVAGLDVYIKRFLPNSDVKVELINDNVVLTGTVDTPLDAKRAAELANLFVSGGEATTGQYSRPTGSVSGGGIIIGDDPDEARRTSKIVNLIQIIGEDQVTLKVTVAEVSRNVMKQLGVKMLSTGDSNGISWGLAETISTGIGAPITGGNGIGIGKGGLQASINAMEQTGVMKTLAEPTLTAVSGEQATFRVGGEFNILRQASPPLPGPLGIPGPPDVEFDTIEYGISLDFKPVVLSPGRISLKVRTAVSEPTNEGVGAAGTGMPLLPSIRKRLADTTVELPSGGSMMIAGLVRDDVKQVIHGLPGASKIPVLGGLFRSRDFIRNETELVVIVTPYLSRPVARNELNKPDDNFNAASDGAGMFLGRVNRVYGTMKTSKPNGRYHGVVGYIYK